MLNLLWLLALLTRSMRLVQSQPPAGPAQTFYPASVPLAVRSPYMSVWYNSQNGSSQPLSKSWPVFWGRQSVMDLQGSIRVDGTTYIWTGQDDPVTGALAANTTDTRITPTCSIFVMEAGPMNVTITYFSPIEPSDWVLQSSPFAYVSVEATSQDGRDHNVQVYSEFTGEWLASDWYGSPIRWSQYSTHSSFVHDIQLQSPQKYVENNQQAQDGRAYFAMASRTGLTWQADVDGTCRGQFHQHGALTNTSSTAFAPIAPTVIVFAIAADLGSIRSTSAPITWAFGYVRNPSIGYTNPDGAVLDLSPYYVTQYDDGDASQVVDAFTTGYPAIKQRATLLDGAIVGNASKISAEYADLVSLAARQTLGSLDITVARDTGGKPNTSDVRIFMKEIATSEVHGRVNPVEQIYAALPLLLYLNASLVGPLLAPLLDAQDIYNVPYAATDIGSAYPNATGPNTNPQQGIEQTGNMLIMLYAHARFSGDGALIYRHYDLSKRWADYLVNNSLTPPPNQMSADGAIAGSANMSNLAIKGIIGVKAMAEMSRVLGEDNDAQHYETQATALAASWQSVALSSDHGHILGVYGQEKSWALMYNLYADKLLGTNVVSQELLQKQTAFYKTLLDSSPPFGLPISNDAAGVASAAWLLFTAATVSDDGVRDALIHGAWSRASFNGSFGPLPDLYDATTGANIEGSPNANGGPSFGAVFSLLALNLANVTITVPSGRGLAGGQSPGSPSHGGGAHGRSPVGGIVGGVIGGLAFLALIITTTLLWRRKHRARTSRNGHMAQASHIPAILPPLPRRRDGDVNLGDNAFDAHFPGMPNSPQSPPGAGTGDALLRIPSSQYMPQSRSPKSLETSTGVGRFPTTPPWVSTPVMGPGITSARAQDTSPERAPSVQMTSIGGASSAGSVTGLRAAVDSLRRAVEEIQEGREVPPPVYVR